MRKILAAITVSVLAMSLFQGAAAKPKGKAKQQVVEGSVAMMLPFPGDVNSCYAGAHRRVAILSDEQVNGITGFHFDVEPSTANQPFVLEATGGQGPVDFDLIFYTKFGTKDDVVNDPGGAGAPTTVTFNERGTGGEADKVPPGMPKAIVCLYQGAAASFKYTAGKGVKAPK